MCEFQLFLETSLVRLFLWGRWSLIINYTWFFFTKKPTICSIIFLIWMPILFFFDFDIQSFQTSSFAMKFSINSIKHRIGDDESLIHAVQIQKRLISSHVASHGRPIIFRVQILRRTHLQKYFRTSSYFWERRVLYLILSDIEWRIIRINFTFVLRKNHFFLLLSNCSHLA